MAELLGVNQFFDAQDFWKLVARFGLDLVFAGVLLIAIYFRKHQNREHLFTCAIINVITFLVCFLLRKVPVDLGFALGLFAVFGILRYRTEPISTSDLTYLFAVIGLAIMNAAGFNKHTSVAESLLANGSVVGIAALLETLPLVGHTGRRAMLYDNVTLLAPGREVELYRDLAARTGLQVESIEVQHLDFLKDTAEIIVSYSNARSRSSSTSGHNFSNRQ